MSDWIRFDGGLVYLPSNAEFLLKDGMIVKDIWGESSSDIIAYRKKEPVKTEYTGVCWAYHNVSYEPSLFSHDVGHPAVKGTYTATHIDGKLKSITWEADE